MPSYRFYVEQLSVGVVMLDEEQSQHARKVMRVGVGDAVEVFDGKGAVAQATVLRTGRAVELETQQVHRSQRMGPWIDLAAAVPKGDRAAYLVEKASELGVDRLIPLITERSVVEPRAGKLERFERIALETAKQCGRAWLMEVETPTLLRQIVTAADHDLKIIADTDVKHRVFDMKLAMQAKRILVLIGPEGGWVDQECELAAAGGFQSWHFHSNILRIETAALAAVAILRQCT